MKKRIIKSNTDPMKYQMGNPHGTFEDVLDRMKGTQVNSCLTSSIPLAEYWQPKNLPRINALLETELPELDLEMSWKFLEYPTPAVINGIPRGPKSMTDLMLIDGCHWKVAVEGKFTEYVIYPTETCGQWFENNLKKGKSERWLTTILKAWLEMIFAAKCTDLTMGEFKSTCGNVGYQFLHRTASACYKANCSDGMKPVLFYQLFYKAGDAAHIAKMEEFKERLHFWAKQLRLKNMRFLILSVPIENADEVEKRYADLVEQQNAKLFEDIKHGSIFKFGFQRSELENVELPAEVV